MIFIMKKRANIEQTLLKQITESWKWFTQIICIYITTEQKQIQNSNKYIIMYICTLKLK